MSYIDQKEIFDKTNGGLDIILSYYPDAAACQNNGKKFKKRSTEKTASATLRKTSEGIWIVTDFGGDQKPRNAIATVQDEEGIDFKEAIQFIASRFNITPDAKAPDFLKAEITKRTAKEDEAEGHWAYELKDISETELLTVFAPKVVEWMQEKCSKQVDKKADWQSELRKVCKHYGFFSLASYTIVKNREAITISSTERYPIFLWDQGGIKKIYQPLAMDKSRRFIHDPNFKRDPNFIYGLEQCKKAHMELNAAESSKSNEESLDDELDEVKPKKVIKLPEIIKCTGGSDALNVAALGYQVIWMNSESQLIKGNQFATLMGLTNKLMNLGDIDVTGLRQMHAEGMMYLDMYTVTLPAELSEKRDKRGNPCKDVRDYFMYWTPKDFENVLRTGLPYRFWDEEPQYDRKGKFVGIGYQVNNVQLYNFLEKAGFYRLKKENEKEGYCFIYINNNRVEEIKSNDIKSFVNNFLAQRKSDQIKLRNTFFRSNQIGDSSLSNLRQTELDMTDFDRYSQFMFFKNKTWKITADGIEDFKPADIKKLVWKEEVIDHRVEKLSDMFTITHDPVTDEYDIVIPEPPRCLFFKFLINTSRVHWQAEMEERNAHLSKKEQQEYFLKHQFDIAGPNLTDEEKAEQKHHLINKIYSLGYILHRYKDPSKPWAIWAMENKISNEGESHGGSGKSVCYKSLSHFMKWVPLDGRNPRLTQNPHIYEMIDRHTDYVFIDDAHEYISFDYFFPHITGDMPVNAKFTKQFFIPFKESPKFCFTSNYAIKNQDPSKLRRLLFTVFSDWYHDGTAGGTYSSSRQPKDDLGKELWGEEFTEDDWNNFINFMAQCLRFFISHGKKINPPMDNVAKRNLQSIMGDTFRMWADVYFSELNGTLDILVCRKDAFENFVKETHLKDWSAKKFGSALKAYCQYSGYELNPPELLDKQGRLMRKIKRPERPGAEAKATTYEMLFLCTKPIDHGNIKIKDYHEESEPHQPF